MASRFFRAFPGSRGPPPHWQNDEWRLYRACKGAPDTGRQATRVGTFSPSLVIRARGCFLARVLRLRFCRRKLRPLSIDPRWCVVCMGRNHCPTLLAGIDGGMITAWSVIALSQQHPTFSRPIWYRMAPRLQGGPLPRRHPPTPLRNAMSSPGTCPTRSSISLILN